MKSIIRLIFLLAVTYSFAISSEGIENHELKKFTFAQNEILYHNHIMADECSVTASGTVEMANGGSFTTSITVYGPCDARLADRLRAAIKGLRDSFK